MEVVIAPNKINPYSGFKLSVFLAGGITNCRDWQSEVIEYLKQYEVNNELNLRVYNPRRPNFNMETDDPEEQIRWEYSNIESTEIFSMYFCNSESDQPICMYELGMHLGRIGHITDSSLSLVYENYNTIISIEDGYKRANDVIIQTKLACLDAIKVNLHATPESHAKLIIDEYNSIMDRVKYNMFVLGLDTVR
jgi:hypothetical protein